MKHLDKRQIVGWIAAGLSAAITCFWAVWGIIENFHEGWYHESLLSNLGLMFVQYLSPMLIFLGVTLVSLFWPRAGAVLHGILALVVAWFFRDAANMVGLVFAIPLVGLGVLYWHGHIQRRRIALCLAIGLPILTLIVAGTEPAVRVSQRLDDGLLQTRSVPGNGVTLTWAPEGPDWPRTGMDWHDAQQACQTLGEDGVNLSSEPQEIWRLPTVDEAVRSMARHGQNSGGIWDADITTATYQTTPDKESPLWNVYSQVIYWWTATEADDEHAYMIAYDGQVWPRSKTFGPAYLGFRCVKP